ncbi:hypothetical protein [Mucilaginibacter sp. dw_454]|uniref:hypothetical protein n=1 Tax=Mucilaginibacter sp. dw_454 TaxID=2720079 RepID=UPI001BD21557|nr:hypothetical protein [Mucilaginibacter sp. dw_454]
MNTYVLKIMIMQQSGTDKFGYQNEDGELQLFIEEELSNPNTAAGKAEVSRK